MATLTPPPTWVSGPVTSAMLNARVRDAIVELQAATAAYGVQVISGALANPALASGYPDGTPIWDSAAHILCYKYGTNVFTIDQQTQIRGGMEMASTVPQGVPTGTWTIMNLAQAATYSYNYPSNGINTSPGVGITVAAAGRYLCHASMEWPAGVASAGREMIAIDLSTSGNPYASRLVLSDASATAGAAQIVSGEISLAANATVSLWGYQNSGATVNAAQRMLQVRRLE